MKPKYAVKGERRFHNVSDSGVHEYVKMIQSLIHEYDREDPETVSVLQKVWKDLSVEETRRLAEMPSVESPVTPAPMLKKRVVKKSKILK